MCIRDRQLSTNNDWQDLIFENAQQSGVNVSVSGGGEKGSFFLGLGLLDQEGIVTCLLYTSPSPRD